MLFYDVKIVEIMQSLRANIEALRIHAASIAQNEATARVRKKYGSVYTICSVFCGSFSIIFGYVENEDRQVLDC